MAWIDVLNANETASALQTRLETLGAKVVISEEQSSSVASSVGSYVLRQKQVVTTFEYRGLTKQAALLLRALASDNSTHVKLYSSASAGYKGKRTSVSASVMTGTVTNVTASRADESGKWSARFTQTVYSYAGNGWSTTEPASSSGSGYVTGIQNSTTLNTFRYNGVTLGSRTLSKTTQTKQWDYKSQTSASQMCSNASDTMTPTTIQLYDTGGVAHTFEITTGTTVSYDMRFVSDTDGWTVVETTVTIAIKTTN